MPCLKITKLNTNSKIYKMKNSNTDNVPHGSTKPMLGEVYWTYNVLYLPIQVKILELDEETRKARIEQGWIDFDRLYNSEDDCPQR